MKKSIIIILIILVFSFSVFAESESGIIKGITVPGAVVVLGDEEEVVGDNGEFVFKGVKFGEYNLKVIHDDYNEYNDTVSLDKPILDLGEIDVSGSEDIDLGVIDFDSSDEEDFIDVSESNVSYELDKDNDEEKINKERNFDVGEVVVSESVMPSGIDYNRDGGSFKSEYSSTGLYNKLGVSVPFKITFEGFKHKVSLNFDKVTAFAKTAQETIKNGNDVITNVYMVDLSTDGYGFAVKYDYQFDKFGIGFLSLGRDYYKHSLDKSEYSSGDSGYSREFRFGKGWSVGGGFVASLDYFNTYELDYVDFSEMKFGFDFEYVPTLIDVKDTDFFANTMVEGSKVEYDLFLGYENYELGYRNVSYNSKEYVSGENLWPATTTTYHGPYFDLTFFF